jgi:hypothetical protein
LLNCRAWNRAFLRNGCERGGTGGHVGGGIPCSAVIRGVCANGSARVTQKPDMFGFSGAPSHPDGMPRRLPKTGPGGGRAGAIPRVGWQAATDSARPTRPAVPCGEVARRAPAWGTLRPARAGAKKPVPALVAGYYASASRCVGQRSPRSLRDPPASAQPTHGLHARRRGGTDRARGIRLWRCRCKPRSLAVPRTGVIIKRHADRGRGISWRR